MKKMLHPRWLLPVTAGAGVLGLGLRVWLFATGFDRNGLLVAGHPADRLSFLLTAVMLAGLFLWLRMPLEKRSYKQLFGPSYVAPLGSWLGAWGILFAHLQELSPDGVFLSGLKTLDGALDRFALFSLILCLAAVAALVIVGFARLRGRCPHPVLHGTVTVYLMVHLVSQYRLWSAEPQLQVYFFPMLAAVFLMLSTYHRTTLDAGEGNLRTYLFFRYSCGFFCILSLCGQQSFFYLTMGLWQLFDCCRVLPFDLRSRMKLPEPVILCMDTLRRAGFESYAVGGCVRDLLLGLTPQDYDICTSALPEQTAALFSDRTLVRSGEKHGTIGVVMDGQVYEITTFRTEGGYSDSRHPDWVKFVPHVTQDLARRDFTVNAMAYSPDKGLIDPFGGQKDLTDRVLRTVGDPTQRFTEDALRILRGVRFAVRYQLTPHPDTEQAMLSLASTMDGLARERVFSELCKLITGISGADLLRYAPMITQVIPELAPTVDFQQHNPHHAFDIYTHTAYVVENVPGELALRLAALLHDIGKPATFTQDEEGIGHFLDHAAVGADMADDILSRLRAPAALRQQVVLLIRQHMTPITPDEKLLRRRLAQYGENTLRQLIALQKADRSAKGVKEEDTDSDAALALLEKILAEQSCFSLKQLAVDGNDLLAAGFAPGPQLGEMLQRLLDMVVDQQIPNEKAALLQAAEAYKEETQ